MELLLGTDICEISRIQTAVEKHKEKFLNKIFTSQELNYCLDKSNNKYASLAARFATKESVSKVLGTGLNGLGWHEGINWQDVELIRSAAGSLSLILTGKAKIVADEKNITKWTVSVSHSRNDAISTVIGYSD